ncbi:MAG: restriction endonuclease subunit R, partial [Muribaculaceae bacterium]|nr:restriction endonuclease subunit R [Muribaculaceae bacterium]
RNSCPQNMVLQISCRCLREVDNARKETALIWLNKFNADKLNQQLQEQQYITIKDFGGKRPEDIITLHRYSRMEKLKLPNLDFYQIKINYNTVETEKVSDIKEYFRNYQPPYLNAAVIYTQSLTDGDIASETAVNFGISDATSFRSWLDLIVKESLGLLPLSLLLVYESLLHELFEKITATDNDTLIFNSRIDQRQVRTDIRNCFATIRRFNTTEELIPESASLLKVNALTSPIEASPSSIFAPDQVKVNEIISSDDKPTEIISDEIRKYLIEHNIPLPETEKSVNDRTYHYLPYHLDSKLEKDYLYGVINHIKTVPGVEFYFNGDDTLTDFRIRCYTKRGRAWKLDGYYYPDFLMLTRNPDNTINKVIIIETKGEGFASKFIPRKQFMEDFFVKLNNEKVDYQRFDFLYIEDTLTKEERLQKTINRIDTFLLN